MTATQTDTAALAGRLRYSVFRLARLLRQQDDTGLPPPLVAALATVAREGPMTLGELAAQEQLSPPSITKMVAALEDAGLVERRRDDADRRVHRVAVTPRGRRQLDASRSRRTAWLATQLEALPAADLDRLARAVDVLEGLTTKR